MEVRITMPEIDGADFLEGVGWDHRNEIRAALRAELRSVVRGELERAARDSRFGPMMSAWADEVMASVEGHLEGVLKAQERDGG